MNVRPLECLGLRTRSHAWDWHREQKVVEVVGSKTDDEMHVDAFLKPE